MANWFEENDPAKQDWFTANAPGITPTAQELSTLEAPEGSPQREDINRGVAGNLFAPPGKFARDPTLSELINASMPRGVQEAQLRERQIPMAPPLPEQGAFEQGGVLGVTMPAVEAGGELASAMMPHDWRSYLEQIYAPAAAFRVGQHLAQGDVSDIPLVGRIPEIMAAEETPGFSKERYQTAMKTLMDLGALGGASAERAPSHLRTEPLVPEPPPTVSTGPTTIAQDVSRAIREQRVPEANLQLAPEQPTAPSMAEATEPAPKVREALSLDEMRLMRERDELQAQNDIAQRATGQTHPVVDERLNQIDQELTNIANRELQPAGSPPVEAVPPPPIGTPLQPKLLVGPNGETPAAAAAAAVEVPVRSGEFAQPGYTAKETAAPVAETPPAPEPYTPEAATARAAQPQPATEPVGGNVAGFEKVYGPGEVPAGETISPEEAWDTASARAQSGKAQPYGFVDRARTGAITPEEMGDLIYEHHRLVERAAGLEGMPEYAGASQAAKDFASNVLKPAETAWHQKGMVMQIERPVNLNTFTGMDQLMQTELGRGIKPSEAPKFTRMAEDVKNGESEVTKAVERSDARVRTKYAKVPDIPIEEAVARVKQMLKDCM